MDKLKDLLEMLESIVGILVGLATLYKVFQDE